MMTARADSNIQSCSGTVTWVNNNQTAMWTRQNGSAPSRQVRQFCHHDKGLAPRLLLVNASSIICDEPADTANNRVTIFWNTAPVPDEDQLYLPPLRYDRVYALIGAAFGLLIGYG